MIETFCLLVGKSLGHCLQSENVRDDEPMHNGRVWMALSTTTKGGVPIRGVLHSAHCPGHGCCTQFITPAAVVTVLAIEGVW